MSYWDIFQSRLNYSGDNQQERFNDNERRIIQRDFYNSPSLFSVQINEVNKDVIITDETSLKQITEYKLLIPYPGEDIKKGDLILWDTEYWICISDDEYKGIYKKGLIQKCNHTLNFYINNQLYNSPAIITNKIGDINEDRYLILPDGKYKIILPANDNTNEIKMDDRFVFYKQAWKVISINYSVDGLVGLSVESDALTDNDNTTTDTPGNEDASSPSDGNLW